MSGEHFDVVVFDEEGYWRYEDRDLTAEDAVVLARVLVGEAATHPDIDRVLITDSGDQTSFLWERGRGIVFPGQT